MERIQEKTWQVDFLVTWWQLHDNNDENYNDDDNDHDVEDDNNDDLHFT